MKKTRRNRGFVAIAAIIVVVLLALIGVYMSTQMSTAVLGSSVSSLGIRGWFAAKSGMDWGIYQALYNSNCATNTVSIGDFDVTITCNSTPVTEGPYNYTVYNLAATARKGNPGEVVYVSRSVTTSATLGP